MKKFNVPVIYRSPLITAIKNRRKTDDKLKKDYTPSLLDFGDVQIYLARHFGFCFGVENAIEISFRTIEENPDKKIYLLSEMIHNPQVNDDLRSRGVEFLMDTKGNQQIPFEQLSPGDIVIVPAFGTTLQIQQKLLESGVEIEQYNTTCPFVEKVWNRAQAIAKNNYTVIVHGKPQHEETRATFSHSAVHSPTVVVKDMKEAIKLGTYISGANDPEKFYSDFAGQYSEGFKIESHLQRIGVVNQTTMLASDTQAIAEFLKETMIKKYELTEANIAERFADTRDTLCYATNDNQGAVYALLDTPADLAIVLGGYNSSNTSHLVELCEVKLPTYFIGSEKEIISSKEIRHFKMHEKQEVTSLSYLPEKKPVKILITSGASCPDALVEGVIRKITGFFNCNKTIEDVTKEFSTVLQNREKVLA
ncbi:MAG TPA: 4-hydroxy-3-methylbut-2-enyl diphosphate reductase [Hanamia sp.]|nr:4-hydroxy-3-methylbut-2-enyl diphosphate reductase [Hanamia sp.]